VSEKKAEIYTRYPLTSILIYNLVTFLHFALGGVGIILGYNASAVSYLFGLLYLVLAFGQMYVLMPLTVCPNCVYYRTENALCTSGLNVLARRIAKPRNPEKFADRAKGLLCHNNLYMASLFLPILAMLPALVFNFSWLLLLIFLAVVGLLLFRFFVIFGKIACVHCSAKYDCPNAEFSGVREM
jgi:hypothetical protein